MKRVGFLVVAAVVFAGCYHATIETGLAPSGQTIDEPFAKGFVYGLVPPPVVETASECPNGVARVETQLSVVNQLVSWLTLGIFTPMHITVTCASGGMAADEAPGDDVTIGDVSMEEKREAIGRALMGSSEGSVLVRFE